MVWIYLAQATVQRQATVMNLQVPYKVEDFLDHPTITFSRRIQLHALNYHEVYLKCMVYPQLGCLKNLIGIHIMY
jgi:hypothetical protein